MTPRRTTQADLELWGDRYVGVGVYTAPGEAERGIEPCEAVNLDHAEIAVPWTLDEIELAHLARGGTLWLICEGFLPVHSLVVTERPS